MSNILLLIVLIAINGLFSATETALLTINTNKLKMMSELGDEKSKSLLEYMGNVTKNLATIQVGITLAGFFSSAVAANVFADDVAKRFVSLGINLHYNIVYSLAVIIITIVLTYFMLVFGELVPKRFGIKHAEKIAFSSIRPIQFIGLVTRPFVILLTVTANSIVKIFGIDPNELDGKITEEEIRMMIDAGEGEGSIDENEKEMINNIFEFDDTSAGDIATHRTDIVAVPLNASIEDIKNVINEEKYSRIPVYDENIDDIVGIFHVKDMVKYILNDKEHMTENGFNLKDILMRPYFVPFSKKTDELFEEMQKEKVHMAIIIDEYGGTAGIVTMEDLLEEIVGNIFDEYDVEEEEDIELVGDNVFLIKGTTSIDKVEELLNVELGDGYDYDTIGGFLIGQLGRIPDATECPKIVVNDLSFQIEKVEEKRIEVIRVSKPDNAKTEKMIQESD